VVSRPLESPNPPAPFGSGSLTLRATHVFERLDLRELARQSEAWVAAAPATVRLPDGGYAVCMRYGVVTFIAAGPAVVDGFLDYLDSLGNARLRGKVESEEVTLQVDPSRGDRSQGSRLFIADASLQRLQLVAEVVARSVVVASYEAVLQDAAASVEPLANELATFGVTRQTSRNLLKNIGVALRIRNALVGRAEVREKPELLWDRPELERLYHQLMDEFEISERNTAIEAKLSLITDASRTALEIIQHAKTLRVEWYIVLLIVFEIALSLRALVTG
jgi:required for meiotic nuclear division protein 1